MKQRIFFLLLTALTFSSVAFSQETKKSPKSAPKSTPQLAIPKVITPKPVPKKKSPPTTAQPIPTPTTKSSANNSATIVGKWRWVGSAEDENKNGIADESEMKYGTAETFKFFEDQNTPLSDMDITFHADKTGFLGSTATPESLFKWQFDATEEFLLTQNIASKQTTYDEFYINKKGELVQRDKGEITIFGKKIPMTTFEVFKKY